MSSEITMERSTTLAGHLSLAEFSMQKTFSLAVVLWMPRRKVSLIY
jgi:hypothetical protein